MSKMTPAMVQKVTTWLNTKVTNGCPLCGKRGGFSINDTVAMPNTIDLSSKNIDMGTGIPMVLVNCPNCAHMMSFSAKLLGLF